MKAMTRRERRAQGRTTARATRLTRAARSLWTGSALVAAAVVVGAGAAGSTYALWNDSVTVPEQRVGTGSIEMRTDGSTALTVSGLDTNGLYPGGSVVRPAPLMVTNQGTVPLSVSWSGTTVTGANTSLNAALISSLREAPGTAPTACTVTAPATSLPTTLTFSLAPGSSKALCLEVRLSSSAPSSARGASATVTLTLDGVQVRP